VRDPIDTVQNQPISPKNTWRGQDRRQAEKRKINLGGGRLHRSLQRAENGRPHLISSFTTVEGKRRILGSVVLRNSTEEFLSTHWEAEELGLRRSRPDRRGKANERP